MFMTRYSSRMPRNREIVYCVYYIHSAIFSYCCT